MANNIEVIQALHYMACAYPNFVLTDGTIKVYVEHLADIPLDQLQRVVRRAIDASEWFPTVSKLRELFALDVAGQNHTPSSFEAWGEVTQLMAEVGHLKQPEFSHPLIDKVVDNLGWVTLCMSDNPVADRARFIQAYEQAIGEALTQARYIPSVRSGKMQLIGVVTKQLESGKESK
jgi:hypothetical protein